MKVRIFFKIISFISVIVFYNQSCYAQIITTVAGGGTGSGIDGIGDGLPATSASISVFNGIAVDATGNVYIADGNRNRVRKVDAATGIISCIAGTGIAGYSGDGGTATNAEVNFPTWVAVDAYNNVYITCKNTGNGSVDLVRKVNAAGIIQTIAGNGIVGFSGDGGPATDASFNDIEGIAVDAHSNLYISDCSNFRVRKVDSLGIVNTIAGNGINGFSGDGGPATAAELNGLVGMGIDMFDNVYAGAAAVIRKINTTTGIISTIAGNGLGGTNGDGGPAINAGISSYSVTSTPLGEIYLPEEGFSRVRKVDIAGIITTVAGDGIAGFSGDGGIADVAELHGPEGAAVDSCGNLYIADSYNYRVRKVTFPTYITHPVTALCASSSDTAVLHAPQGYYNYSWSTGSMDSSITVNDTGVFVLQSHNLCGTRFDTFNVRKVDVNVAFTLGPDSVYCSPAPVILNVPIPNASYLWQDGSTDSTYTVTHSGDYSVTVNDSGCSYADTVHIGLINTQQHLGNDTALCTPSQQLILNANVQQGASVMWSTGSAAATITVDTGAYWVSVSDSGCQSADTIYIGIVKNRQDLGDDTTLCNPTQQLTLKANVPQGASVIWSTGSTGATITAGTGTYWVNVTDSGCHSTDTIHIGLTNTQQHLGDDTTVCAGQLLTLRANVPQGALATWSTGSTDGTITADSGMYWVTVTDSGCIGTDTINIHTQKCNCILSMPTAFTPNNDGKNDVFHPIFQPGCVISNYTMFIYNRWGQVVFNSAAPSDGWDGTAQDKPADIGVYMYKIQYSTGINGQQVQHQKGEVTLVR